MQSNKNLFTGNRIKVLWNASVIHEKRLEVIDGHIEKILVNGESENNYKNDLDLLNKKIDILAKFRNEFNEYKKDMKNIKNTIALLDTGDLNEKIEELNNNKLSTIVYLNNIKEMRKIIKTLKNKLNKLSNDYDILNLSHEQIKLNYDNNEFKNYTQNPKVIIEKSNKKTCVNTTLVEKNTDKKPNKTNILLTNIVEEKNDNSPNLKMEEKKEMKKEVENKVSAKPDWLKYKIKKNKNNEKN